MPLEDKMAKGKQMSRKKCFFVGVGFFVEALIVFAVAFFYSHWTAYSIAAQHLDGQTSLPFFLGILFLICFGIVLYKTVKGCNKGRNILLMVFFAILIIGCVYAYLQTLHVECPACTVAKDEWYKTFFRYFNGREYQH